jgi:YVTN family beta-propeller protein
VGLVSLGVTTIGTAATAVNSSHSTTIALTNDDQRLVVVNREANSVSIIQVKDDNGNDVAVKLAEIGVGEEPRCVAIHPNDKVAYVTNGISGTVSVVDLELNNVAKTLPVGTEPRGCALTADGSLLYVANHTEGTVSLINVPSGNPLNPSPDGAVQVGGRPTALAITNRGTGNISDDTVFVTQIFAELDPTFIPRFNGDAGEASDLGKRGVVHAFPAGNANPPITKITLSSLKDSGFTANRVSPNNFCNTVPPAQSNIFCPNPNDLTDPINTSNPQGVFPNQLLSAVVRNGRLFLPNIGAQPGPCGPEPHGLLVR